MHHIRLYIFLRCVQLSGKAYMLYTNGGFFLFLKWGFMLILGILVTLLQQEVMRVLASPLAQLEHDELDVSWVHSWNVTKKKRIVGGFDFYKWSLPKVGVICSFGVAAATICALLFGGWQKEQPLTRTE